MKATHIFYLTIISLFLFVGIISIPDKKEMAVTGNYYTGQITDLPQINEQNVPNLLKEGPVGVIELESSDPIHESEATLTSAFDYYLGGAQLIGEAGSLKQETALSINGLDSNTLPPLNGGMINVTGEYSAYRMLPHGTQFNKDIRVILPYDTLRIPPGFTARDIKTYYYNEISKRWIEIQRDTVDVENRLIVSRVNHFTDFINAVIKVPEMPETQAYVPNTISDIKAANPLEGITMIQPPTANSQGTANLSYSIEIPAGRQGMQPNLTITYSSEGGNSWIGNGWDLNIPSISVDTRWGVPRYSHSLETETYMYNGEELTPLAHRDVWEVRSTGDKQFYPRVEGEFAKIIRRGLRPTAYWWEVIDKQGTRYFYGSTDGVYVNTDVVLRDPSGNIAYWPLCKVIDLNNNFVNYHYTIEQKRSDGNNIGLGSQLWLDAINYTGHEDPEAGFLEHGPYEIIFTKPCYNCPIPPEESELCQSYAIPDTRFDARYGFRKCYYDKLSEIKISYSGTPIRTYRLCYEPDPFMRSRLSEISVYNHANLQDDVYVAVPFYEHIFEYYDEIDTSSGNYKLFGNAEPWTIPNDDLGIEYTNSEFANKALKYLTNSRTDKDKPTALGGSQSLSIGFGPTVSAGIGLNSLMKTLSVGYSFSTSGGGSEGCLSLMDINGDGLPDKVFRKDGKVYYRLNTGYSFGEKHLFGGLSNILKSTSNSFSHGPEGSMVVFGNYTWETSNSYTSTFACDINGDGFLDFKTDNGLVINKAKVYPPVISNPKDYCPMPSVEIPTSPPTGECEPVEQQSIEKDPAEEQYNSTLKQMYPSHEIVRVWKPMYSSYFAINVPFRLLPNTVMEEDFCGPEDGVILSVQYNETLVWEDTVYAGDYRLHNETGAHFAFISSEEDYDDSVQLRPSTLLSFGLSYIDTNDILLFRSRPIKNGVKNKFQWDIEIADKYAQCLNSFSSSANITNYSFQPDANGLDYNNGNHLSDNKFLLSQQGPAWIAPMKGTINIESFINKPVTTDDITYRILRNGMEIASTDVSHDQPQNKAPFNKTIVVNADDKIEFKAEATTNIDWAACPWQLHIYYTAVDATLYPGLSVYDNDNNRYNVNYYPVPEYGFYNDLKVNFNSSVSNTRLIAALYTSPSYNTIEVQPEIAFTPGTTGEFTFAIKKLGKLLHKESYPCITTTLNSAIIDIEPNDVIYLEYYISDPVSASKMTTHKVHIGDLTMEAPLYTCKAHNPLFGHMYRGWGQFLYNGKGKEIISMDELILNMQPIYDELNAIKNQKFNTSNKEGHEMELLTGDNIYNKVLKLPAIPVLADGENYRWRGINENNWLGNNDTMLNLGIPCHDFPLDKDSCFQTQVAMDGDNSSGGNNNGNGGSSGTGNTGTGSTSYPYPPKYLVINKYSITKSKSWTIGADIGISLGTLESKGTTYLKTDMMDLNGDGLPDIINNGKVIYTLPFGGYEPNRSIFGGEHHKTTFESSGFNIGGSSSSMAAALSNSGKAKDAQSAASLNVGASNTNSKDIEEYTLMDVNGDGLPDMVFADGRVRINTGYSFDSEEQWYGHSFLNKGEADVIGISAGVGVNVGDASISGGINKSSSENKSHYAFVDINGDGLPDLVREGTNGLLVVFNTGATFSGGGALE